VSAVRLLFAALLLAQIGLNVRAGEQDGMVVEESAEVVMNLHRENQNLKYQVDQLTAKVDLLQRELAATRLQLDAEKIDGGRVEQIAEKAVSEMIPNDISKLQVMEVNRKMRVAVVSGGLRAGMKVGMRFSVLRDNLVIAAVRLVEIRENFAGGLIENMEKDQFPEVGDRLILSNTQD